MSSANTHQDLQQFWNQHIQSYEQCGHSKARYCRDNSLSYHQFIYWAARLSDQSTIEKKAPASKLIPILVKEPDSPSGLQVHLPNGVLISGISGHSVEIIGRLIDQL